MTEVTLSPSRKEQIKKLLRAEIEGEASVNLPELANAIVEQVKEDEQLAGGLLDDIVRPFVYETGRRILAQTRGESVLQVGDDIVGRSEFEDRARILTHKFERWMEHAGESYINFMEMRSADLLEAAKQREARADTERAIARFERYLAGKLTTDERVGDRYTPEELDNLWNDVNPADAGEEVA